MGLSRICIVLCIVTLHVCSVYCDSVVLIRRDGTNTSEVNVEEHKEKSGYKHPLYNFLYDPGLSMGQILELEKSTWHWYPWKHVDYHYDSFGQLQEDECEKTNALDDLPDDMFTQEQRLNGAIILHFIGAIYFFTFLAVVCNDYFLPSVECICEDLEISEDVAAATFMAIAGTTPEFFTHTISIFIANSDMGLGTIIGSMLFNTLGVAACAGMAAQKPVQLNWFPLARDSIIFSINISILVTMAWDGQIMWYETVILFVLFILYFVLLFQNHRFERIIRYYIEGRWRCCKQTSYDLESDKTAAKVINKNDIQNVPTVSESLDQAKASNGKQKNKGITVPDTTNTTAVEEASKKKQKSLWVIPRQSTFNTIWWFYTWPIRFLLTMTIPSPKTYRNLYPLTFVLCIIFIGLNSFMVFWMVAIIGYTFGIPDAVMGLTLLAWGGCLPEGISTVIIVRKGRGGMGVSNSLGSNSLAILMSLGLPWFIRTMADGAGYTGASITIYSYGIEFTIISLLLAVACLFTVLSFAKYRLKKTVGIFLICVYLVFMTLAILIEMDIILPSGNC